MTTLDAAALRLWCDAATAGLSDARAEIDALNVFPVPDGDTGTNLFLTMHAAAQAARHTPGDDLCELTSAVSRAALLTARGNAGIILSEFLRALGEALSAAAAPDGAALADALSRAADGAYAAVDRPVEGTMLTVVRAAAEMATHADSNDLEDVAAAATHAAAQALRRTPEQLPALAAAGVVDAGGRGVCVLLDALHDVVSGKEIPTRQTTAADAPLAPTVAFGTAGPAFEVMYLLETTGRGDEGHERAAVAALRRRLAPLGDSLLVVGGGGLWNVHVHVDDVGAAIEAALDAGRPYRIRVTHFATQVATQGTTRVERHRAVKSTRHVVAVAAGGGLVALLEQAGADVLDAGAGRPSTAELLDVIERTASAEVVLLPGQEHVRPVAEAAARRSRASGVRVAVVPTREPVQALAALAVHDADRPFDDDVVAMTAAAQATRAGALLIADRRAITSAGVVEVGQVMGLVDGEVVTVGGSLAEVGITLLDSMLPATGELVTLVVGKDCPAELADVLAEHVRAHRPDVEVTVYDGQQAFNPMLIGVE